MQDDFGVDAMPEPGADRPLHWHPGCLQALDRGVQRLHRHDLVGSAVDQEHRRPAHHLGRQMLGAEQRSRVAEDGGQRRRPAKRRVEREHRTLGESDQRELTRAEGGGPEFGVEEGVQHRQARLDPCQQRRRPPIPEREPLPAERRHVAGLRPVGCDEGRVRQALGEHGCEADQVVALGADAVQQDHELARRPWLMGWQAGAGQERHSVVLARSIRDHR